MTVVDLVTSAVLSVAAFLTGIAMAAITRFRPIASPGKSSSTEVGADGLEERTGWGGMAMLALLFAANRVAYVIAIRPRVRRAVAQLSH